MTSQIELKKGAQPSIELCIICQKKKSLNAKFTEAGRNKIIEAASIRNDEVHARICMVGIEFVYDMDNACLQMVHT